MEKRRGDGREEEGRGREGKGRGTVLGILSERLLGVLTGSMGAGVASHLFSQPHISSLQAQLLAFVM